MLLRKRKPTPWKNALDDRAAEQANKVRRRTVLLYPGEHIPCPLCAGHMIPDTSFTPVRLACLDGTCPGKRPATRIVRRTLPVCKDCGRSKDLIGPNSFRCPIVH